MVVTFPCKDRRYALRGILPMRIAQIGRFNLAQGTVGTLIGISAALSTSVWGLVAQHLGGAVTFPAMAAVTAAGMALLWTFLPETKPAQYDD